MPSATWYVNEADQTRGVCARERLRKTKNVDICSVIFFVVRSSEKRVFVGVVGFVFQSRFRPIRAWEKAST